MPYQYAGCEPRRRRVGPETYLVIYVCTIPVNQFELLHGLILLQSLSREIWQDLTNTPVCYSGLATLVYMATTTSFSKEYIYNV
jgi:hypothetical protein